MSNIEPLAREVCERICRHTGMAEPDIPAWVDSHWEAAAAEIEAGNCGDTGEIIPGSDWRKGLEASGEADRQGPAHKAAIAGRTP